MGLLGCCGGGAAKVAEEPGPSALLPLSPENSKNSRNALVRNGPMLMSLLSKAQQEELRTAFSKFDLDESGTMCESPSHMHRRATHTMCGHFPI